MSFTLFFGGYVFNVKPLTLDSPPAVRRPCAGLLRRLSNAMLGANHGMPSFFLSVAATPLNAIVFGRGIRECHREYSASFAHPDGIEIAREHEDPMSSNGGDYWPCRRTPAGPQTSGNGSASVVHAVGQSSNIRAHRRQLARES